jgi:hypothetical protein
MNASLSNLLLALPATLLAIGALSYGLRRALRDKSPGLAVNAGLLSVGMAAGVGFMALCQSFLA